MGNYVGNATSDITTRRSVSGNREYTTRDMGTLVVQPVVTWGVTGDVSASGDFDGDGSTTMRSSTRTPISGRARS